MCAERDQTKGMPPWPSHCANTLGIVLKNLFEETGNSGVNVLTVNWTTVIENELCVVSSAGSDVT